MSIQDLTIVITTFKSENAVSECLKHIDKDCKVINIENSNNQTGSLELQKSFIDKVQSQIVDVDQKPLLPIASIGFWKKFRLFIRNITNTV